ncbi:hypothetical protein GlitD10_1015 [Gloeomargarita lithophora Alchichica-D10]|uniref:DUF2779 domain-containing protein n=1 Tax=Gloeomargarita lithophora Alchichica-D10 TaxID=1188229 RepID=A0A1J0ABN7_9CYAN|nr:DUF2779 domain-containing protein [Gloeomargarita lithophora]APB33333.1 hypothetical protein GlitD10_1015 [Gloeomargarita lithophora Alchichica-D10]
MMNHLTKSRYIKGLQCPKYLWLDFHDPGKATPPSDSKKSQFQQGTDVGILGREYFPGGVLVTGFGNHKCQEKTANLLTQGVECLFEATFKWEGIIVKCDVLRKTDNLTWELFEIKSSTKVKDEHIEDLAIQWYVVQMNGIHLKKAYVMHINNQDCFYPDLSNLFTQVDVTSQVQNIVSQLPQRLQTFYTWLSQPTELEQPIGEHCTQPYTCNFKEYCWHEVPEVSIFQISRLDKKKKAALIAKKTFHIEHLSPDFIGTLSTNQQMFIHRYLQRETHVNYAEIKNLLSQLIYPLYFFDFEAGNPAIPRFNGVRPYQRIPFQFSCHILTADGELTHCEYLHTDREDPRPPLIQALVHNISNAGSVIVYNQGYEKSVLQELATFMPEFASHLHSIVSRLWDQMAIFQNYYQHPDFLGSISLKKVLPVLVPNLSYKELAINQGDMAKNRWETAINSGDLVIQAQTWEELREYCHQDTLAMVEIHHYLTGLINSNR